MILFKPLDGFIKETVKEDKSIIFNYNKTKKAGETEVNWILCRVFLSGKGLCVGCRLRVTHTLAEYVCADICVCVCVDMCVRLTQPLPV